MHSKSLLLFIGICFCLCCLYYQDRPFYSNQGWLHPQLTALKNTVVIKTKLNARALVQDCDWDHRCLWCPPTCLNTLPSLFPPIPLLRSYDTTGAVNQDLFHLLAALPPNIQKRLLHPRGFLLRVTFITKASISSYVLFTLKDLHGVSLYKCGSF